MGHPWLLGGRCYQLFFRLRGWWVAEWVAQGFPLNPPVRGGVSPHIPRKNIALIPDCGFGCSVSGYATPHALHTVKQKLALLG